VGAPLIVCEKRILASGTPVIYSVDYLPKALFGDVDWQALDWSVPVFDLLEEYCGILVDTNITRVAAVAGSPARREKLLPAGGEALILLDEVGYYKLSRPIIHSHGFYTNYFEFAMLRKKF
jgi:GntR family transcriptional regulator